LAGVLCLPLIWLPVPGPSQGGVWFTLLDVGQGLAAVVRTAGHTLVYDTGPRLGAGLDAGAAAVAPFLTQFGGQGIDTLIISHADSQHMGGTRAVLESMGARRVLTPSPRDVPVKNATACRQGMSWIWDEVKFSLLHPPSGGGFVGDNASCVLLVESRGGRVLLPGDIEPPAEAALARAYGISLRADVLVAPHHGSRAASLVEFLAAVAPRFVLFSTAYRNRFGYPRSATTIRYGEAGARVLDTGRHGAITFRLEPGRQPIVPELQRHRRRHYWQQP
jgi:competence protein ComEC